MNKNSLKILKKFNIIKLSTNSLYIIVSTLIKYDAGTNYYIKLKLLTIVLYIIIITIITLII